jgi:hypothetical protein
MLYLRPKLKLLEEYLFDIRDSFPQYISIRQAEFAMVKCSKQKHIFHVNRETKYVSGVRFRAF